MRWREAIHNRRPQGGLVSSDDVEGMAVHSSSTGERIGSIHHLVIDKITGKVAYADVSFGGLFGVGEEHKAVPWQALRYDLELDGFVTDVTEDRLQSAPEYLGPANTSRLWEEDLYRHYGFSPYWSAGL